MTGAPANTAVPKSKILESVRLYIDRKLASGLDKGFYGDHQPFLADLLGGLDRVNTDIGPNINEAHPGPEKT
jgi:hypothetical protein